MSEKSHSYSINNVSPERAMGGNMSNNLEIYEKYRKVPKEACKSFDNGKFKGTDINSMWRIKCLTEQFGVVGFGWTTRVIRTWTEQGADNEILAFAEIGMKVKINGEWGEEFTATGGNTMVRFVKSKGYHTNSDEAFKMAITDAFGVACKYLGIGADIYWDNDKSKYTEYAVESDKPIEYITDEQIEQMNKLNVNITNAMKWAKIDDIKKMTKAQADFVIGKKKEQ